MKEAAEENRRMASILLEQADAMERDDYRETCDECGNRLRWSDNVAHISPPWAAKLFPVVEDHKGRNYAVTCCDKHTGTREKYYGKT